MPTAAETLQRDARRGNPSNRSVSYLFLVLYGDPRRCTSIRFSLDKVREITIGRGPELRYVRDTRDRRLAIEVADSTMSALHVRLGADGVSYVVEDLGSRNGTFVNGVATQRALLSTGDVIELGTTFFVYGMGLSPRRDEPPEVSSDTLQWHAPGLETLLPDLSRRFSELARVAPSDLPVLILGESGTGKELAARAVHTLARTRGAFVPVNCGALPQTLIEAQLYGYRKGAFTGATQDQVGLFRSAETGTLFLDEIADLPLSAQASLLRALQEHEVLPLGATRPIPVSFRVVAATHQPLGDLIRRGVFREDLFSRLAGFTIELPPLKARRADMGLLLCALLSRFAKDRDRVSLDFEAARALLTYAWPRNIRQLENTLRGAVALSTDSILLEHLPQELRQPEIRPPEGAEPPRGHKRGGPKPTLEALVDLLRLHHGNVSAVARALGTTRAQIHRWTKRHGVTLEKFRRS